jgi:hypothetical protein
VANRVTLRDRQSPSLNFSRGREKPEASDYAITSRVRDPATGALAVVAGGISPDATRRACEFLASGRGLSVINAHDAKAWGEKNLQIVLNVPPGPTSR